MYDDNGSNNYLSGYNGTGNSGGTNYGSSNSNGANYGSSNSNGANYGSSNSNGTNYGGWNMNYGQNMYTQRPPVQPTPQNTKPPKKKGNIFLKVAAAIVCAVLLGGIAGVACYGVSYAGYAIFPIKNASSVSQVSEKPTEERPTKPSLSQVNNVNKDIKATVYDVSDIVEAVITSVVKVNGTYTQSVGGFWGNQTYQSTVSGSGIIIGSNDDELLIVTNAHVIEDIDTPAITFYDGSKVDVEVKGYKNNPDLAVLAVKFSDIPAEAQYSIATLGDSSGLRVGEAAIAVGNSMGYGISVTTGCISALDRSIKIDNVVYENLIQTDAAINPGNSGGALFNAYGEVIGINSAKMTNTSVEGMGYAISISSVKDIIEDLSIMSPRKQLPEDERGYLGIKGVTITSTISQTYGRPEGVEIRSLTKGWTADNAGLVQYDIITSFDGATVSSINELIEKMSYYAVGEEVEVEYYHLQSDGSYAKNTVTVKLMSKPED